MSISAFIRAVLMLLLAGSSALHAALIVHEPFDYPVGALAGQNGGTGWTNGWTGNGNNVVAPSLTYRDGTNELIVTGNACSLVTGLSGNFRYLPSVLGGPQQQRIYISFLGRVTNTINYAGLALYHQGVEQYFIGQLFGFTPWWGSRKPNGSGDILTTNRAVVPAFIVARLDFFATGGQMTVRLYIDPPLAAEPLAFWQRSMTSFSFDQIRVQSGASDGTKVFDEIRIGTTWDDVVPRRLVPAELSVSDAAINEDAPGGANLAFDVRLNRPSTEVVRVTYGTHDGTAQNGSDYNGRAGILIFPPGVVAQRVQIPVIKDMVLEGDETLTFRLSAPVNALIADGIGVGTILDGQVQLSIEDVTVSEIEDTTVNANFRVTLSGPLPVPIVIDYETVDGSAQSEEEDFEDYGYRSGRITIPPGITAGNILVPVFDDTLREAPEHFFVLITGASQRMLVDLDKYEAVGTILDNDREIKFAVAGRHPDDPWVPGNSGTTNNLRDIWFRWQDEMWAVGDNATILNYDGNPSDLWWSEASPIAGNLQRIHGNDQAELYAVGGTVMELAQGWTVLETQPKAWGIDAQNPPAYNVRDIWVSPESRIFAVGALMGPGFALAEANYIRPGEDLWKMMWFNQSSSPTRGVSSVFGFSENDVYCAQFGESGQIYHFDGNFDTLTVDDHQAIGRFRATSAIGGQGFLWLGGITNPAEGNYLLAIADSMQGPGLVIYRANNGTLTPHVLNQGILPTRHFGTGAWANSISNLFVTGYDANGMGQILHHDGARWQIVALPPGTRRLNAIWGIDTPEGPDVVAVGDGGTIVRLRRNELLVFPESQTIAEGETASFEVILLHPSTETVTVDYSVYPYYAYAPEVTFEPTAGTLVFAPGETIKDVSVKSVNNRLDQERGGFRLVLANSTNANISPLYTGLVFITDDDPPPVLTIDSPAEASENPVPLTWNHYGLMRVNVRLSEPSGLVVYFSHRIVPDFFSPAGEGQDFFVAGFASDDTVWTPDNAWIYSPQIPPGETNGAFYILIHDDAYLEGSEHFSLLIEDPSNATLAGRTESFCTIIDNDVDSDNDGMTDRWEMDFFGTLARDGTADFDNDRLDDIHEFEARTLPDDPQSRIHLAGYLVYVGNEVFFTIRWTWSPGHSYRLECADSLAGPWQVVFSGRVGSDDSYGEYTVPLSQGFVTQQFYRFLDEGCESCHY